MDNTKLISVVIPNYNGSRTITKTIDSLKNQSFTNFDVTIVDDCSRDNSVSIISDSIKDLKNFKLVKLTKNKGASNARNYGIKESKGEIILFTDSDVILKKDTIQKVADSFQKNKDISAVVGLPDKESSLMKAFSLFFLLIIDMTIVGFGIIHGALEYFNGERY